MRISRWDQADPDVFQGCYQTYLAAAGTDDPQGPRDSGRVLRLAIAERAGGHPTDTWVAADGDGTVAGWYSLQRRTAEDVRVAFLGLVVHPRCRRHGLGTELLRHAAGNAMESGRSVLAGETFAGTAGEAFARRFGAVPGVREARTALDVAAIAPGKIAALHAEAAAAAAGYSLVTWTGPVPDAHLAGYARVREAMNDAPSDFEDQRWDEQRVRDHVNVPVLASGRRRYTVAAVHDATAQLTAYTVLSVDPGDPEWGRQNTTVVAPAHRGHRLGLLLKTAMLEWSAAAEPQVRRIETGNATGNQHMIAINQRLGFAEFPPSWQEYQIPVAALVH